MFSIKLCYFLFVGFYIKETLFAPKYFSNDVSVERLKRKKGWPGADTVFTGL